MHDCELIRKCPRKYSFHILQFPRFFFSIQCGFKWPDCVAETSRAFSLSLFFPRKPTSCWRHFEGLSNVFFPLPLQLLSSSPFLSFSLSPAEHHIIRLLSSFCVFFFNAFFRSFPPPPSISCGCRKGVGRKAGRKSSLLSDLNEAGDISGKKREEEEMERKKMKGGGKGEEGRILQGHRGDVNSFNPICISYLHIRIFSFPPPLTLYVAFT